jgi:hypothetical protein
VRGRLSGPARMELPVVALCSAVPSLCSLRVCGDATGTGGVDGWTPLGLRRRGRAAGAVAHDVEIFDAVLRAWSRRTHPRCESETASTSSPSPDRRPGSVSSTVSFFDLRHALFRRVQVFFHRGRSTSLRTTDPVVAIPRRRVRIVDPCAGRRRTLEQGYLQTNPATLRSSSLRLFVVSVGGTSWSGRFHPRQSTKRAQHLIARKPKLLCDTTCRVVYDHI